MAQGPTSKKPVVRAVAPVPAVKAATVKTAPPAKKAPTPKTIAPVAKPAVIAPVAKPPLKPAVAKPVQPKPVAVPPVPVVADKPVVVAASATAVKPAPIEPVHVEPVAVKPAAPAPVAVSQKDTTMNDTITKVQDTIKSNTEEATAKATAFFNDANGRAKDAMAKGTKAIEELVEFQKGNLEAMVASGRVAAKGAEDIAKYSAEYGRATIEKANATAKQFAAVKSPTEFFQLQGDIAKQTLDSVVAEGSKFTESYLKLLGEIAQPIQNRVAVAVEKVKTSAAA